jgi:hypothetical protein
MIFVNKSFLCKVFLTILVKNYFQKISFKSSAQNVLQNILSEWFLSINLFSVKFFSQFWLKILFKKNFLKSSHIMFSKTFDRIIFVNKSFLYKACLTNFWLKILFKKFPSKVPTECLKKHFSSIFSKKFLHKPFWIHKFYMKYFLYKFCIENKFLIYIYIHGGTKMQQGKQLL